MDDLQQQREKELIGRLGAVPSPEDTRDYKLDQLVAAAPKLDRIFVNPVNAPVFDQGQTSECVACSLALCKYHIEYRQTGDTQKFSPNYIYGNRGQSTNNGEGLIPREALSTLVDFGVPHYSDDEGFMNYPQALLYYNNNKELLDKNAHPYRITSYYRLNTLDEMKQAIALTGAITAMFPVYDCLYEADSNGQIKYNANKSNHNYGYHEMTLVGWNDDLKAFDDQNSWGISWGKNGHCNLPYNYPIIEAWCFVDNIIEKKIQNAIDSSNK